VRQILRLFVSPSLLPLVFLPFFFSL
jgi:hypothetical protein